LSARLVYSFVTLPAIAVIFIYFRQYIVLPTDPLVYLLTVISIVMAAFIQFFITYSLAMFAFWILEISTIFFIVYSFEYFLGGQMFRSTSCQPGVQAVMKWLPFYYELFCPVAHFSRPIKRTGSGSSVGHPKPAGSCSRGCGHASCGKGGSDIIRPLAGR
jgi:ABC-2 type transport system permease protein